MIYLLDTNAVIALMAGDPRLLTYVKRHKPQDFGLSSIVAHELYYGAYKSQRKAANVQRIDALQFPMVEFNCDDARHAGEIRATLAALGKPVGPYDVLIAGQARARTLTLVTRNLREFERVEALAVESW